VIAIVARGFWWVLLVEPLPGQEPSHQPSQPQTFGLGSIGCVGILPRRRGVARERTLTVWWTIHQEFLGSEQRMFLSMVFPKGR
jgi:hypothetical protein